MANWFVYLSFWLVPIASLVSRVSSRAQTSFTSYKLILLKLALNGSCFVNRKLCKDTEKVSLPSHPLLIFLCRLTNIYPLAPELATFFIKQPLPFPFCLSQPTFRRLLTTSNQFQFYLWPLNAAMRIQLIPALLRSFESSTESEQKRSSACRS